MIIYIDPVFGNGTEFILTNCNILEMVVKIDMKLKGIVLYTPGAPQKFDANTKNT